MKEKISINCHSSIKIKGSKTIYFDPYKIEEETKDADVIFITHNHYDHFDLESVKKIMNDDTLIVVPNTCANAVIETELPRKSIIGVSPNEQYYIKEMNVNTICSYNIDKDFHPKDNYWVGYIVEFEGKNILVTGDTDCTEELKQVTCDIALIPIDGKYTMSKEKAAELINQIKPELVIPTHYGTVAGKIEDGESFKELIDKDIECLLLIK